MTELSPELDKTIQAIVDKAPPLTPQQIERLRAIFRPVTVWNVNDDQE